MPGFWHFLGRVLLLAEVLLLLLIDLLRVGSKVQVLYFHFQFLLNLFVGLILLLIKYDPVIVELDLCQFIYLLKTILKLFDVACALEQILDGLFKG